MTGAGSATGAYAVEDEYGELPSDPTWIQPGLNMTVSDLTVDQALSRIRGPTDPTPKGSRLGDFEGALGISWDLTDANYHELVFADDATALPNSPMRAPSSAWYLAVELPDGSVEPRTPTGTIVPEATVNYEQGEAISAELTMLYGYEPDDVDEPDDSDIERPSESDVYSWHGASFDVDGLNQPLMSSASLSLAGLARFRRGQERHPYDAVVDAIEPEFQTDAVFTERDQLALAVDDVDDSDIEEMDAVDGEFALENGQGDTITYTLSDLQPTSYGWADLIAPDADLTESIQYHVSDVEAEEVTA